MASEVSITDILKHLVKMEKSMVTKRDVDDLRDKMREKDDVMEKQDDLIKSLYNTIELLKQVQIDTKQRSRKNYIRIYNVERKRNETSATCLTHVQKIIRAAGVEIPIQSIDRAYRVGTGHNKKPPVLIVRFTNSRHRTLLYKKRRFIRQKLGYALQVDLAQENLRILKQVRTIGENSAMQSGYEFAYANVNCVLYVKVSGKFHRFKTVQDAINLMGLATQYDDSDDEGVYVKQLVRYY